VEEPTKRGTKVKKKKKKSTRETWDLKGAPKASIISIREDSLLVSLRTGARRAGLTQGGPINWAGGEGRHKRIGWVDWVFLLLRTRMEGETPLRL